MRGQMGGTLQLQQNRTPFRALEVNTKNPREPVKIPLTVGVRMPQVVWVGRDATISSGLDEGQKQPYAGTVRCNGSHDLRGELRGFFRLSLVRHE